MKKLLYLLLLLPFGFLASCSDDDDFPSVNITTSFDGGTFYDNTIYAVVGDTLSVQGIEATPIPGTKNAAIANPVVFWNHTPIYPTLFTQAGQYPSVVCVQPGTAVLSTAFTILQEDKSIATGENQYLVKIVADSSELPSGANPVGPFQVVNTIQPK